MRHEPSPLATGLWPNEARGPRTTPRPHACCAWIGPAHEDLALGVSGAPEINHPPIDFQIDFVEMPGRMRLRVGLVAFTATNNT